MITRTTTALLDDLLDPANQGVWSIFDERYRPVLIGLARRTGLTDADAADAAQDALLQFVRSYRDGKFDRSRGRLRSWLLGIARHCIADIHEKRTKRREQHGLSAIDALPDAGALEAIWNEECDHEILRQAMDHLRATTRADTKTIRAFEMQAFEQATAAETASELDMSMNDVYLAKHRCLTKLRAAVDELRAIYDLQ